MFVHPGGMQDLTQESTYGARVWKLVPANHGRATGPGELMRLRSGGGSASTRDSSGALVSGIPLVVGVGCPHVKFEQLCW